MAILQDMRIKTNIPIIMAITFCLTLSSCNVAKMVNISPDTGEGIRKSWTDFSFRDFNTTLEYKLDETQFKKRKQSDLICDLIKNDLYYTGDFFRQNFHSRNGLTGIETVKCGYDQCLPIKQFKYCNAKFIIYSDTSNNVTIDNAGDLAKLLIQSDKYFNESIYKIHFEIYISFSTNYDEQTKIANTEVTFNTNIFLRKRAPLGTRWVSVRDIDVDENKYRSFENIFKNNLSDYCDKLLTQKGYLIK